jgi:hypothetical protein
VENSSRIKSATAHCPQGTSVTNAGGDIHGGVIAYENPSWPDRSYVVIDDLFPNEDLTSVTVTAIEKVPDSHFTRDWYVTAIATCTPTPDGLEWVWEQSATDSTWYKQVYAECPGDKVIWGTGATIEGGDGQVVIDQAIPWSTARLEVRAYESGGMYEDWNLNALAICADPPPEYEIVWGADDPYDGADGKSQLVACPDGLIATGGGFEVFTFDGGQVTLDLIDFSASVDPTVMLVEAFETQYSNPEYWAVRPMIICADV